MKRASQNKVLMLREKDQRARINGSKNYVMRSITVLTIDDHFEEKKTGKTYTLTKWYISTSFVSSELGLCLAWYGLPTCCSLRVVAKQPLQRL